MPNDERRPPSAGSVAAKRTDKAPKRRRRRKPIDLKRVQIALGEAIEQLEHYILEPAARGEKTELEVLIKVSYALAQVAGSFKGIVDSTDLQKRLEVIEAHLAERQP